MQTLAWFVVILLLTLCYGMRIRRVVGFVESPLVAWYHAAVLAVGIFIGAVLVTQFDIVVPERLAVALHAILLFFGVWLGVRYWIAWRLWDIPSFVLALSIVTLFFVDPQTYNSLMFGFVTLGCSVGGYFLSKRALVILCCVLAVFDGFAVWGSNMMDELIRRQPGPFPSELLVGSFFPRHFSIGVLDALLAGLVIVGLVHHRGALLALRFTVSFVGIIFAIGVLAQPMAMHGITFFAQVPLLVVLAPLATYFLTMKRHQDTH